MHTTEGSRSHALTYFEDEIATRCTMRLSKKDIEMFSTNFVHCGTEEYAGFYTAKNFPEDENYVEYQEKHASKEPPE